MLYTDFAGEKISALGFGLMRLPLIEGDDKTIDEPAVYEMVDMAIERGINYFDTAYRYHNGNSELVAGRALSRHPRESYHLASKFPSYDVSYFGRHEEIFQEQLEKCQTDYFDFYLMHNVNEANIDLYLDKDDVYRTVEYFVEQKEAGRIRHLGFSTHAAFPAFRAYMERHGVAMEFCQIQHNYLDWTFQDTRAKIEYLQQHGVRVNIMEPLRGGNLVDIPEDQLARLQAVHPDWNAIEWAFRYAISTPGLLVALSGMSSVEQMRQNLDLFDRIEPLNAEDAATLLAVGEDMANSIGVPCTSCRYCTTRCPQELDIPELLKLYNEQISRESGGFLAPMRIGLMPPEKRPSACIACRSCTEVCPQQIDIPTVLAELAAAAENGSWPPAPIKPAK